MNKPYMVFSCADFSKTSYNYNIISYIFHVLITNNTWDMPDFLIVYVTQYDEKRPSNSMAFPILILSVQKFELYPYLVFSYDTKAIQTFD